MQKLRNLYTINYNAVPANHPMTPVCYDPHAHVNYYGVPSHMGHNHTATAPLLQGHAHGGHTSNPHVHNNQDHTHLIDHGTHGHVVEHSHTNDLSFGVHYTSTTARKYTLTPSYNGALNFTISPTLLFREGNAVYVSNFDLSNNYFQGIVTSYNKITGEMSINQIQNITGTFTSESTYLINIIFQNPEVFKLEEKMNFLYKYLFNVNLTETINYQVPSLDIVDNEKFLYKIYLYLFNLNIRTQDAYEVSETYFTTLINNLYLYLFLVNLTTDTTFNPNGNSVSLSTLTSKISQLYLYFFGIDLATNTTFNPN